MKSLRGNVSLQWLPRLKFIVCALILFGVVLVHPLSAFGQGATGAINGTVADTSGGLLFQDDSVLKRVIVH